MTTQETEILLLAVELAGQLAVLNKAGAAATLRKLVDLGVGEMPPMPDALTDAGAKVAEDVADTAEAIKVGP